MLKFRLTNWKKLKAGKTDAWVGLGPEGKRLAGTFE